MTLSAVLAVAPVSAQTNDSVYELVGVRSATGQAEMRARGFTLVHTDVHGETFWQYWWHGARNQCVLVTMGGGQFERITAADAHDCNQHPATLPGPAAPQAAASPGMSDGAKVALGAAALLGVAALLHKSHQRKKERANSSAQETADFERGYRDGLYQQSYQNYNSSGEYSDGYSAGSRKRVEDTRYRSYDARYNGYAQ